MRLENPQSFNAGRVGDEISVDAKPDALNQGLMRNTTSKNRCERCQSFLEISALRPDQSLSASSRTRSVTP